MTHQSSASPTNADMERHTPTLRTFTWWLASPGLVPWAFLLARRYSRTHCHVQLEGSVPGSGLSRTRSAGQYVPALCEAWAKVLQAAYDQFVVPNLAGRPPPPMLRSPGCAARTKIGRQGRTSIDYYDHLPTPRTCSDHSDHDEHSSTSRRSTGASRRTRRAGGHDPPHGRGHRQVRRRKDLGAPELRRLLHGLRHQLPEEVRRCPPQRSN